MSRGASGRVRLLAAIAVAALLTPSLGHAATEPLVQGTPPCLDGDVVVDADPFADHATVLLDRSHRLPEDAAPSDLVAVTEAGFPSEHLVRRVVIGDLRALREEAAENGLELAVQSGYRSFAYQRDVHAGWVAALGEERARRVSARPGHSEHQLGTAVDLRSAAGPPAWELDDWAATHEGAWVAANAHRFGFVMSYPEGAEAITCYDYEPWHYRWIGRGLAERVQRSGLPLRAWLLAPSDPAGAP